MVTARSVLVRVHEGGLWASPSLPLWPFFIGSLCQHIGLSQLLLFPLCIFIIHRWGHSLLWYILLVKLPTFIHSTKQKIPSQYSHSSNESSCPSFPSSPWRRRPRAVWAGYRSLGLLYGGFPRPLFTIQVWKQASRGRKKIRQHEIATTKLISFGIYLTFLDVGNTFQEMVSMCIHLINSCVNNKTMISTAYKNVTRPKEKQNWPTISIILA